MAKILRRLVLEGRVLRKQVAMSKDIAEALRVTAQVLDLRHNNSPA